MIGLVEKRPRLMSSQIEQIEIVPRETPGKRPGEKKAMG